MDINKEKLSGRIRVRFSKGCCRQNGKFYPRPYEQKMLDEVMALEAELAFIHSEYGKERNENLTKDALWLKIASLESRLVEIQELLRNAPLPPLEALDRIMEIVDS